ncbi:cyclic nucleotide-binding domain-containing protein [Mycobacterium spongiae]|uniref:Cyclic nucleotide-binding domain-containing protein n=1 Tax=Mycobacterium spongiae TaxID=886343 RepID=A0A975JZT0_9MYCO|nr:cyclic nucleotide-binding domain-containing protein [Mycobacterium spongiae]QUR68739.1 cyclic nucleotide-binding domain-containing protein [Mycobacterium spongiae]
MMPITTFPLVDAIVGARHRSLDGVVLIAAQHLLETTHAMLRSLFGVGLDPRNVALIGKCYSTHLGVVEAMRADGIYVDDSSDAYAPHEPFDAEYTRNVERFFGESWDRLVAGRSARVVLLDDGGSLLATAGAVLDGSADVIGIEQTSAGYAKILGCQLGFPVINIARSSAKLLYESPIIAARVTQTAFERISAVDSGNAILITGAGAIGTALAQVLRPCHDLVDLYDPRSGDTAAIDLPEVIGDYDVIIGATGATSVPAAMHELLRPDVVLMSASSSDREFDAVALRQRATPNYDCHADLEISDGSVNATLLNSGFPVNFDGSAMCGDASMALTMALLAAAVVHAASAVVTDIASEHPHLGLLDQGDIVASFLNIDVPLQALSRLPLLSIGGYRRLEVRSGEILFHQGDQADHFFVVESGELEALVDGEFTRRLCAGDHFGEIALLNASRRTATVRARDPSVLWALDGTAFSEAVNADTAMRDIANGVVTARLDHAAPASEG